MLRNQLLRLEEIERESALQDATKASEIYNQNSNASLSQIIHLVYGIGDADSHIESGCLANMLCISGKTVVTIFPYRNKETFERAYGYSVDEIVDASKAGHVVPIIQRPMIYEGLDYLDPILGLSLPSYFIRAGLFYAILFGDDLQYVTKEPYTGNSEKFETLFQKGKRNKVIRSARIHRDCWEPYQQLGSFSHKQIERERVIDSFAFKYSHACCFLGEDVVNFVLTELPPEQGLALLTHLHMRLDHPISQGLLTTQYQDIGSEYYRMYQALNTDVFSRIEKRVQMDESGKQEGFPLTLPIRPTASDLDQISNAGIPLIFNKVRTVDAATTSIDGLRGTIEDELLKTEDAIQKLNLKAKKITFNLSAATWLLSVLSTLKIDPVVGITGIAAIWIRLPEHVVDIVTERLRHRIRDKFLSLLWQIRMD